MVLHFRTSTYVWRNTVKLLAELRGVQRHVSYLMRPLSTSVEAVKLNV